MKIATLRFDIDGSFFDGSISGRLFSTRLPGRYVAVSQVGIDVPVQWRSHVIDREGAIRFVQQHERYVSSSTAEGVALGAAEYPLRPYELGYNEEVVFTTPY